MIERKQNRLNEWNYNSIGYYYITINTKDFKNYFGQVQNKKMKLSYIGQIASRCWLNLPDHIKNISLDNFIIMPNHFHGIIKILPFHGFDIQTERFKSKSNEIKLPLNELNIQTERFNVYGTGMPVPYEKIDKPNAQYKKLPIIIGSYKSAVSKLAHKKGYGNFGWHKSYYDHIVRNEKDLYRIRKYITNNPANWNKF